MTTDLIIGARCCCGTSVMDLRSALNVTVEGIDRREGLRRLLCAQCPDCCHAPATDYEMEIVPGKAN